MHALGLALFTELISRETLFRDYPQASKVTERIPIYDGDRVRQAVNDPSARLALCQEWASLLETGPGVFAIRAAVADLVVLNRATDIFSAIIDEQRQNGSGSGDHFAQPGANDRVWNSLEKHALKDPDNFVAYYSSTPVALAAEAWLGPASQMTAQVNRVNPGGGAQVPHRDYHLGFMSPKEANRFPAAIHAMSPLLTLQGAIAHCDMSVESGPTMYLPYSQQVRDGYVVFGEPDYQKTFSERYVQIPLSAGDAVFFNPALMHGAGQNRTTDVLRMANLLQISSAFGRAMEVVDRDAIIRAIYPVLVGNSAWDAHEIEAIVSTSADGYPFPTNLDVDPRRDGLAPPSQADLFREALENRWSADELTAALGSYRARRGS